MAGRGIAPRVKSRFIFSSPADFHFLKQAITDLLVEALQRLERDGRIPAGLESVIQVTPSKQSNQGDFASNAALVLAKQAGLAPRDLAQAIVERLAADERIERVEIAGPGFINFYTARSAARSVITNILATGDDFGRAEIGNGVKVQVEFVSANPTGPLHVGHGRGAAYGATLANLLAFVGYQVEREYYVNDAGRQMHILAVSTWLRYLDLCGESIDFPSNGYKGDYIWDIAATLHREHGERLRKPVSEVFAGVSQDAPAGDKEKHIDDLIDKARSLLGAGDYGLAYDLALDTLVDVIRRDLHAFGVDYDCWFSERSLADDGLIDAALERLEANGHLYRDGGALWFRSTDFGDEKDRVVRRDNGQTTYFASDIAYHMNKFERGFERVINIWGADHHGYIARVKASLAALGYDAENLEIQLVQFANLYENGAKVAMSTRSGEFVTLKQLREDVGRDAARFFYVMRKSEQHMDFDLDLAREQSRDNPVFYVHYAHARICSVRRECAEKDIEVSLDGASLELLDNSHEEALIRQLSLFPERIESAARRREPHLVVNYLRELANFFHSWYDAHKFIVDDADLRNARIALAEAVGQVLRNGLRLVGVSAPEKM